MPGDTPLPAGKSSDMAISSHASCVTLPRAEKPYPSILTFLTRRFPAIPRATWEQRMRDGKVLDEGGTPITPETPYLPQQRLFYFRENDHEPRIPLQEHILFQSEHLIVACKPPFLPVTPAGPYVNECLLQRLRSKTGNCELVPVHRIDRETSGLVLFSCNRETRGRYGDLFRNGCIEKTYEALSAATHGTCEHAWTVENRLIKGEPWFRMMVSPGAVNARSRIERLACEGPYSRFRLRPVTGKQHQLRLHMSGLGFPIMHDRYYPELLPRQADDFDKPLQLIARRVQFTDPVSGQQMEFESQRKLLY